MAKRRFNVTLTHTCVIELDDAVIKQVDDDWRKTFYRSVVSPEDVAAHVAYNMLRFNCPLSMVEGFANLDDSLAKLSEEDWDTEATAAQTRKRVKVV